MKKMFLLLSFFMATLSYSQLMESYVARIGPNDHFNSNGERLKNAAQIIRQDRANYHKFGKTDSDDQGDSFFGIEGNRKILENMLSRGSITPEAKYMIINENPLIEVKIYSQGYIDVSVYGGAPATSVHMGNNSPSY